MRNHFVVLSLAGPLVFGGCSANYFEEFYRPTSSGLSFDRTQDPLQITDPVPDGLLQIGVSDFYATNAEVASAERAARKIGAHYYTVSSVYADTVTSSGVIPITLPTTQTAYHSGSVRTPNGRGTFSGTSTSYGSSTTFIPYSNTQRRYRFTARFYRDRSPTTRPWIVPNSAKLEWYRDGARVEEPQESKVKYPSTLPASAQHLSGGSY